MIKRCNDFGAGGVSVAIGELATSTEVEKALTKQFGWSKADNNYRAISYYDYNVKAPTEQGSAVAVIFANGAIMDGEETPGNVGGDTTAAQIRDARLDPKVKAIVLRVNSPGGSVSASEVIAFFVYTPFFVNDPTSYTHFLLITILLC